MRNMGKMWKSLGLLQVGAVLLTFLVANVSVVAAQQVTGVPGSARAMSTIDGKQIPAPPPKFGGVIKQDTKESTPWWPLRVVPPKGATNVFAPEMMSMDPVYHFRRPDIECEVKSRRLNSKENHLQAEFEGSHRYLAVAEIIAD